MEIGGSGKSITMRCDGTTCMQSPPRCPLQTFHCRFVRGLPHLRFGIDHRRRAATAVWPAHAISRALGQPLVAARWKASASAGSAQTISDGAGQVDHRQLFGQQQQDVWYAN